MYIYFDTNGTIKEIVNDKSIRNGSNEANKIYCYLEGEPEIDDIWYLQKLPSGELSNEVSFKNSTITKAIPYDAKRDMKYFKDFEQYKFYVFTLNTFLTSQKGLNIATIRVSVDNTIWALGELTFNVQENVINVDNGITQSQYDYLLLAYASRTLNEQVGSDLNDLIDDKIEAKLGDLASGSPKVFDTEANIEDLHDDYGIAVATDTGDIWVWNDTQEQYVNTNYKYLNDASNIVYHDGNQLKDGSDNDFYPNIADGCVTQEKLDNDLFDDLLLKETTDITSSFTLQNRYLDKANGNANPDANSRCTDFIDLSQYGEFFISGFAQYATCMICTYDENQQFLRYYCDGGSAGVTYTDYDFIPQSDEKYAKFGTYQYTTHPLIIKSVEVIGKAENKTPNYLYKKKYVACGDSFTKGDVIASNKVYPYLIAERNNMTLVNMSANGSYAHNGADGFTNSSNSYYYQNIPLDADYITIAYGLNETSTTIGTKDSADNTTIWGAYNEILTWIITNIPNAKVGIISNDAWMTYELRNALQEIASYYGVSFLDLKEYGKPMMISGKYTEDGDVNSTIKNLRTNQYCVSNLNGHPNELGHRVRSYIIENFLRGMDVTDNRYTKTETDNKFAPKSTAITHTGSQLQDYSGNNIYPNIDTTIYYNKTQIDDLVKTQAFYRNKTIINGVGWYVNYPYTFEKGCVYWLLYEGSDAQGRFRIVDENDAYHDDMQLSNGIMERLVCSADGVSVRWNAGTLTIIRESDVEKQSIEYNTFTEKFNNLIDFLGDVQFIESTQFDISVSEYWNTEFDLNIPKGCFIETSLLSYDGDYFSRFSLQLRDTSNNWVNISNITTIGEKYSFYTDKPYNRVRLQIYRTTIEHNVTAKFMWVSSAKDGFIKDALNPKTYYLKKDGTGDFTSIVTAINTVCNEKNATLYIGDGTWDIVSELGTTFMESVTNKKRGLYLKNGVHIICSSKSLIVAKYAGTNATTREWFSAFNAGEGGFTLENATIESDNIRYTIHDERDEDADIYYNHYINCKMKHTNGFYVQCIGGGLGLDGHIIIDGCIFETDKTSSVALVSYHNSMDGGWTDAESKNAQSFVFIKNNYLGSKGFIQIIKMGKSQKITNVIITNNSLGSAVDVVNSTNYYWYDNVDVKQWNNEVRS